MNWKDAVAISKCGRARRDDDQYPLWWRVLANGNGKLFDDSYLVEHINLDPFDRDRWDDWEPDEPKDAIEELAKLIDE